MTRVVRLALMMWAVDTTPLLSQDHVAQVSRTRLQLGLGNNFYDVWRDPFQGTQSGFGVDARIGLRWKAKHFVGLAVRELELELPGRTVKSLSVFAEVREYGARRGLWVFEYETFFGSRVGYVNTSGIEPADDLSGLETQLLAGWAILLWRGIAFEGTLFLGVQFFQESIGGNVGSALGVSMQFP